MKILLTGASGFIGSKIISALDKKNIKHVDVLRSKINNPGKGQYQVDSIDGDTTWENAFDKVNVVVHTAARAHIMNDEVLDPLTEYRAVNTEGTLNLARQAATNGVKRFIFVSSIKVNGEATSGTKPFTEQILPEPQDPYGISKMEAEDGLRILASETGMEVVIIRPPLVYGPNVKANFLNLMKLADTGIPLPFGAINNKRSMVYVENLVDFIIKCIDHPAAANQTFLISDDKDLSLTGLLKLIRSAFGRSLRLLPVPALLFHIVGKITGKTAVVDRLIGDLQVDSSKAENLLGWTPPFTVEEGIKATVTSYSKGKN